MVVNIFSNFVLIIKIYAYIGIARMFTKSKKLDLLKDKTRLETNVLMVMKLTMLAYFYEKLRGPQILYYLTCSIVFFSHLSY